MTFVAPLTSAISVCTPATEMEKRPTCRSLFGPVDHAQLRRDIQALHKAFDDEAERRWNFNFKAETPHPPSDDQRFHWVGIPQKAQEVDGQEKERKEDTEAEKELSSLESVDSSTQLGISLKVSCSTPVSFSAISSESVETPNIAELDISGLPAAAAAATAECEEGDEDGEDEVDSSIEASEYRGLKRKRVMKQSTIPDYFQMKKNKNCSTPTKRRRLE